MPKCLAALFISGIIFSGFPASGQDTLSFWDASPTYSKQRGQTVGIALGATYVVSMTGLYSLWYADYPLGKFHNFNDNGEWLQVDKIGHLGSSYYMGKWGIELMQWTGMPEKKATWVGGSMGLAFLTTIEIFDGFSENWGFSYGDMISNVAGTAMAISQQLAWKEQRISIKFSFHDTKFNKYNPSLLGEKLPETLFKDYNGQTYWLSFNIKSFLREESKFPSWLNVAAGYGAEGMIGARDNDKALQAVFLGNDRYRQFYVSPDIDLTKIKTNKKLLKTLFSAFGFIKFPAPALEFNNRNKFKVNLKGIYF